MGNSKVIFGNETLIDLTGDTVTPDTLLAGTTAHNRSGEQIVGTATVPEELDDLTDVTITSPAEGDLLQRNGNGEWVNSAVIPQKVAGLQETGCVNLFDNKVSSQVVGGVTFVANGDKSVTLHGTSTENIIIPLNTDFSLPVGRNLIWSSGKSLLPSNVYLTIKTGTGSGSSGDTVASCDNRAYAIPFTVPNVGAFHTYLWIGSGVTFNNYTIYPMASYFYTGYQPYSMTNRELTERVALNEYSMSWATGISQVAANIKPIAKFGPIVLINVSIQGAVGSMNNWITLGTLPADCIPKDYKTINGRFSNSNDGSGFEVQILNTGLLRMNCKSRAVIATDTVIIYGSFWI